MCYFFIITFQINLSFIFLLVNFAYPTLLFIYVILFPRFCILISSSIFDFIIIFLTFLSRIDCSQDMISQARCKLASLVFLIRCKIGLFAYLILIAEIS